MQNEWKHYIIRNMVLGVCFVCGNCPVAHHGQYQGKEGKPTIVVEALADYNLYAWHAVFCYAGTLNDISIWDSSYLLQ
jgi:hypothetical protein